MNNNQIAPSEILELHNLLNANILEVKKMSTNAPMIQDESLKSLVQNSINAKKTKIQELQNFINSQLGGQLNSQNNNQNNNQNNSQSQ